MLGLRLKGAGPSGEHVEAHPPLLLRVAGHSRWGPFAYQPVLARQGRRITREHQLPLALMGHLLELYQAGPVPELLVLGGGGRGLQRERIRLTSGLRKQLGEALRKLKADLERAQPPALAADRRKCTLCSWRESCSLVAAADGHLSEVSGIGAKRRDMLQELGIHGLNDLASANPERLAVQMERFGEQHGDVTGALVAQAIAQRDGLVERLDSTLALPELQRAPGVLLYDIESDPDARHDFLHGFLRLPRQSDGGWDLAAATYHPLLVLAEHGEQRSWLRLQRLLSRYEGWPILHYGETETLSLRRLAQRQGASDAQLRRLKRSLIDVHARIRSHWRLPLSSYGLKSVAAWRGFRWSQSGVDGARALLWWRHWVGEGPKRRGSRHGLAWIFRYNQDDCRATWAVAEWLLKEDDLLNTAQRLDQPTAGR